MVRAMFPAVRRNGTHLVATTTFPGAAPSSRSAEVKARSDCPPPYISAVSNQLIPPSRSIRFALR